MGVLPEVFLLRCCHKYRCCAYWLLSHQRDANPNHQPPAAMTTDRARKLLGISAHRSTQEAAEIAARLQAHFVKGIPLRFRAAARILINAAR